MGGRYPIHLVTIVYGVDYPGIQSRSLPPPFPPTVHANPNTCLRLGCSSRYLRISPLHREFPSPLSPSREAVSSDLPRLSRGLSHRTRLPTYARFTPSKSGQRWPPTYYRGCWHVVSRGLFAG